MRWWWDGGYGVAICTRAVVAVVDGDCGFWRVPMFLMAPEIARPAADVRDICTILPSLSARQSRLPCLINHLRD